MTVEIIEIVGASETIEVVGANEVIEIVGTGEVGGGGGQQIDLVNVQEVHVIEVLGQQGPAGDYAETLSALQAVPEGTIRWVYLLGRTSYRDGGQGNFVWDDSDLSAEVAAAEITPDQGDGYDIIALASDRTGASGAFRRVDGIRDGSYFYNQGDTNAVDTTVEAKLAAQLRADSDYASLALAIADIGAVTYTRLLITQAHEIAAATTVTVTTNIILDLTPGGTIDGATGAETLAFATGHPGIIAGPRQQIFGASLAVTGLKTVFPDWWGTDEAALQAAHNVVKNNSGEVIFNLGTAYTVADTVIADGSSWRWRLAGGYQVKTPPPHAFRTILSVMADATKDMIQLGTAGETQTDILIDGLFLDGDLLCRSGIRQASDLIDLSGLRNITVYQAGKDGIDIDSSWRFDLERVTANNCGRWGLHANNDSLTSVATLGQSKVSDINAYSNGTKLAVTSLTYAGSVATAVVDITSMLYTPVATDVITVSDADQAPYNRTIRLASADTSIPSAAVFTYPVDDTYDGVPASPATGTIYMTFGGGLYLDDAQSAKVYNFVGDSNDKRSAGIVVSGGIELDIFSPQVEDWGTGITLLEGEQGHTPSGFNLHGGHIFNSHLRGIDAVDVQGGNVFGTQMRVNGYHDIRTRSGSQKMQFYPLGGATDANNVSFQCDGNQARKHYVSRGVQIAQDGYDINPYGKMWLRSGESGQTTPNTNGDCLILESNVSTGLSIFTPSTKVGSIYFGDEDAANIGRISYDHDVDQLTVRVAGGLRCRWDSTDGFVWYPTIASAPTAIGEMCVAKTNNTTLTFKLMGSDGVVRTANLTLS